MRYFGSKGTTIDQLYNIIADYVPRGSFCDPFGGIGSVSSYFKLKGYKVFSGDILNFAHYFQIAKLGISNPLSFEKLLAKLGLSNREDLLIMLNSLKPKDGWFVNEYSEKRKIFY